MISTNPSSVIQKFSQTFIRYIKRQVVTNLGSTGKKFHLGKNKKVGTFQDASIDSDDQGRQRRGLLNQPKMFFFLIYF